MPTRGAPRCEDVLSALESERFVCAVVKLDATGPEATLAYEVAGAEIAGFLDTWFRLGGWKSIRIAPQSGGDVPSLCVEL